MLLVLALAATTAAASDGSVMCSLCGDLKAGQACCTTGTKGSYVAYDIDASCCTVTGVVQRWPIPASVPLSSCPRRTRHEGYISSSDGCTLPQWVPPGVGAFFEAACDAHDACYDTCGASRASCDLALYRRLRSECHRNLAGQPKRIVACEQVAAAMYSSVAAAAKPRYERAQRAGCECCPGDEPCRRGPGYKLATSSCSTSKMIR